MGDVIVYTGEGGRDPKTGTQVADQEFRGGNRALAVSCDEGLPVRVVRGARGDPACSPATGLRYDGLIHVDPCWHDIGMSGFRVYRYGRRTLAAASEPDWAACADALAGDTSEP